MVLNENVYDVYWKFMNKAKGREAWAELDECVLFLDLHNSSKNWLEFFTRYLAAPQSNNERFLYSSLRSFFFYLDILKKLQEGTVANLSV